MVKAGSLNLAIGAGVLYLLWWITDPRGLEATGSKLAAIAGANAGATGGASAVNTAGDQLSKLAGPAMAAWLASQHADSTP